MKFKIKKIDFPVYLYYFIITFCKGIDLTRDNEVYTLMFLFGILFLGIRIICQNYSLKQILTIVAIVIVGLLIYYFGHNSSPLFMIIAICSLKDINIKKVLKMIFYVHLFTFLLMLFLSSTGIIANNFIMHDRNAIGLTKRYFFGYQHPNLVQTHLLSLTMLYFYLFGKKANVFVYVFWFVFNFSIFNFTFSRTSFYLSVIFLICYFMFNRQNNNNKINIKKILAFCGKHSFFILFIFTLFLALTYKTFSFSKSIDDLLTGRIYYLNYIINKYPVPIIGQRSYGEAIAIDNSFFGILYQGGIIFTMIMYLLNFISVNFLWKQKKYNELMFILFLNLLCFTEDFYLVPTINFMLLIYGTIFFILTKRKDQKNESYDIDSYI